MEVEYFKYNILPLKNKLFRKALLITGSATDAQDIVQEVMICLWDKRSEWPKIRNMEVYAMVLTKNLALDKTKKRGYRSESIENNEVNQLSSDWQHPQERLEKAEQINLVWKIINQLPKHEQELIKLREIEGRSYDEIASEMNITESQVKTTLFRARKKVKEIYMKISRQNGY